VTWQVALAASLSLNLVLWLRGAIIAWRSEEDIEIAYRQGKREGWFDALRHVQVGRDQASKHFLN